MGQTKAKIIYSDLTSPTSTSNMSDVYISGMAHSGDFSIVLADVI